MAPMAPVLTKRERYANQILWLICRRIWLGAEAMLLDGNDTAKLKRGPAEESLEGPERPVA